MKSSSANTRGITITYRLAIAAATDAANRNMRAHARTVWNDDDFGIACQTFERLMGTQS